MISFLFHVAFVFTSHSNCFKLFISHYNRKFAFNCQFFEFNGHSFWSQECGHSSTIRNSVVAIKRTIDQCYEKTYTCKRKLLAT